MWKILNGHTSNDIGIKFNLRPRFGHQATLPTVSRVSLAVNQTVRDSSFSVMGPRLWNCIPHELTTISELEPFKTRVSRFLCRIPDMPPVRGYSTTNSNSILDWRVDRATSALWGGQPI